MIEVKGLRKSFGSVRAVDDVSFTVPNGSIYGLLGPNGAGKTTTLRILATLLKADGGSASVAGFDVARRPEDVRRAIGVVNGGMGLYDRLTGREILQYFGRFYGMTTAQVDARTRELDALLDLRETLDRQTSGFSTGMKQKIVIARAVLHDPPVLFFDEAASGLDVLARRALLDFVKAYPKGDRTVVFSTHVMSEVEELCDRVAVIYGGRLIAEDTPDALVARTSARNLEDAFFRLVQADARANAGAEAVVAS